MTTWGPYPAVVLNVHDGDTMTAAIDVGFNLTMTIPLRIYGINAPELATQAGKDALAYAETLVKVGDRIMVVSHGWDKYAPRADCTVNLPDGSDFGTLMLNSGHAIPYAGATP